ncbi:MAG: nitroreductase family deazaflavin-dependent oxidoreductase [Anaerolineales bacterium]|nr:nitroreductase family deazaflavin-dependent oxidoreductase [Anaerolineales bacterium]
MNEVTLRRAFRNLNRYIMVPLFRLGFGTVIGNPLSGYIMVIETIGNRTGKRRFTPVNYAIVDGHAYCLAGYGRGSHWLLNLHENPKAALIMPGRRVRCMACELKNEEARLEIARQILINAGFAGFYYGYNPRTVDQERLRADLMDIPVIKFECETTLQPRSDDPGGKLWVIWLVILIAIIILVLG